MQAKEVFILIGDTKLSRAQFFGKDNQKRININGRFLPHDSNIEVLQSYWLIPSAVERFNREIIENGGRSRTPAHVANPIPFPLDYEDYKYLYLQLPRIDYQPPRPDPSLS